MVICLDKDTLSCVTCRRKIERALWVELGFSEEFCDVGLSCIIYPGKSELPVRDRIFENCWQNKYRTTYLIWFLGITHQRVSLEKLWTIRTNSQHRKNLTISTTVRIYSMISEAETSKRVLFTSFPSEIIFWQLTGSGEDVEDFLGRKLSELESGILCGQCWDILLGLHEIGLPKRYMAGTFYLPWIWAIFYHRSRTSPVVVLKAVRNGHLFR